MAESPAFSKIPFNLCGLPLIATLNLCLSNDRATLYQSIGNLVELLQNYISLVCCKAGWWRNRGKARTMAKLVLLGTKGGPSLRAEGASFLPTSSHLAMAGRSIIIDCGLGVTASLVKAGYPLTGLTDIFVTHCHSDHVLEFGALLHTAWTAGLDRPVSVFGPPEIATIWRQFCEMMRFDITIRMADEGRMPFAALAQINIIDAKTPDPIRLVDVGGLTVSALRNDHPPVVDSYALRFDADGKSITFSGDTRYLPSLAGFAKNSDVLVHEAMLEKGLDHVLAKTKTGDDRLRNHLFAAHSFAEQAGQIAAAANAGHLVLNHLIPPERDICNDADWQAETGRSFDGRCSVGHDGMAIEF
ncbi:MBL fold metallo-hydrolase [Alphaproteobacteria bacterium]|nr:MBL fold metallo-hydrolase [Alphaproteobacteria bacterium]